jgi:hypothetical protein
MSKRFRFNHAWENEIDKDLQEEDLGKAENRREKVEKKNQGQETRCRGEEDDKKVFRGGKCLIPQVEEKEKKFSQERPAGKIQTHEIPVR